jgi:hypothetical protein
MKFHQVEEFCSLLERAALRDRTAEMAAEVARDAKRAGQADAADAMWTLARRCRVKALKLRAQAVARKAQQS